MEGSSRLARFSRSDGDQSFVCHPLSNILLENTEVWLFWRWCNFSVTDSLKQYEDKWKVYVYAFVYANRAKIFLLWSKPWDSVNLVLLLSYIDCFTKIYCLGNHRFILISTNYKQLISSTFSSTSNEKKVGTIKQCVMQETSKIEAWIQEMNPNHQNPTQNLPASAQLSLMSSLFKEILPESEYSNLKKFWNLKTWCDDFCFLLYGNLYYLSRFCLSS